MSDPETLSVPMLRFGFEISVSNRAIVKGQKEGHFVLVLLNVSFPSIEPYSHFISLPIIGFLLGLYWSD